MTWAAAPALWPVMMSFTTVGRAGPDEYLAASSLAGSFPLEPPG
jgi:hypothetical protein